MIHRAIAIPPCPSHSSTASPSTPSRSSLHRIHHSPCRGWWCIVITILFIHLFTSISPVESLGLLSFNVTTSSSSSSPTSPSSSSSSSTWLPFTNVSYNPCRWGRMLSAGIHRYELVAASGTLCDASNMTSQDYTNKAVIVMRGSCAFSKKAIIAEQHNAALVIIYNCQPGVCATTTLPYGLDDFVPQAGPGDTPNVTSIYVTYEYGSQLVNSMMQGHTFTISIEGTGSIDRNDLYALQSFYSTASQSGDWRSGIPAGDVLQTAGLLQWSNLRNPTFDPCVNRIWGLWCVGGRITTIDCEFCNAHGYINPSFYQLDQLRFVSFRSNNLQGALPGNVTAGMGIENLKHLNQLYLDGTSITSIPDNFGALAELYYFNAHGTLLKSLPSSMSNCRELRYFDVHDNSLQALPVMDGWSKLAYIDVSGNHIAAPLLNFRNFPAVTYVNLGSNQFAAVMQRTSFDYLPSLRTLLLNNNNITGVLPQFASTTVLDTIDFSGNQINDTIPPAWSALSNLTTLKLRHNNIYTPIDTLSTLPMLAMLDLSKNRITCGSSSKWPYNKDVASFLSTAVPPSIQSADFSYNQINCSTWGPGWGGTQTKLRTLILSHNNINSYLPTDLWTTLEVTSLIVLDLSFNDILGDLPQGGIPPSLQTLDLTNNPDLRSAGLAQNKTGRDLLPPYIQVDTGEILPAINGTSTNMSCPLLMTVDEDRQLHIQLDPSYHGYTLCKCQLGFYGTPPNCIPFPTSVYEARQSSIVTDGDASGRLRMGMDVSYIIQPTPNVTEDGSPILSISIAFGYFALHDVDNDIVYIHTGSNFNTGKTLATYTESQPPPPNVTFPGNSLTMRFMSDSESGPHFNANYVSLSTCPPDYVYEKSSGTCVPASTSASRDASNLPVYIALAVVGVVLFLVLSFIMWRIRKNGTDGRTGVKPTYDFAPLAKYAGLVILYDFFTKPLKYSYGEHSASRQGQLRQLACLYVMLGGWAIYFYGVSLSNQFSFESADVISLVFLCHALLLVPMYCLVRLGFWLVPVLFITVSPCVLSIFLLAVGGYVSLQPVSALLFLIIVAIITCHFLVNSIAVFAQAIVTVCMLSLLYVHNAPSISWEYIGCYSFFAAIVLMMSALSTKAHQEDIQSRMLFTSTISHELRTPLTGIIGNLELLLDTDLDDHQKDCGTVALYSSERMLELLNEFLDYAKIEVGKMEIINTEFDIKLAIHNSVAEVAQRAHSKHLDLSLYVAPTVPTLGTGDMRRVRQCLINLLSNAIKFCPEDGTVEVDVLSQPIGHQRTLIVCEVIDSGQSLSQEEQAVLFKKFSQVDAKKEGTGLGLVIVKQLATLMKGSAGFQVMSTGNMFWFSFQVDNTREPDEHEDADEQQNEEGNDNENDMERQILDQHGDGAGNIDKVDGAILNGDGNRMSIDGHLKITRSTDVSKSKGGLGSESQSPNTANRHLSPHDKAMDSRSRSGNSGSKYLSQNTVLPLIGQSRVRHSTNQHSHPALADSSSFSQTTTHTHTHAYIHSNGHPSYEDSTNIKHDNSNSEGINKFYNHTGRVEPMEVCPVNYDVPLDSTSTASMIPANPDLNDAKMHMRNSSTSSNVGYSSNKHSLNHQPPVHHQHTSSISDMIVPSTAYATPTGHYKSLDQLIRNTLRTPRQNFHVEKRYEDPYSTPHHRDSLQHQTGHHHSDIDTDNKYTGRAGDDNGDGSQTLHFTNTKPLIPAQITKTQPLVPPRDPPAAASSEVGMSKSSPLELPFRVRSSAHYDNAVVNAGVDAYACVGADADTDSELDVDVNNRDNNDDNRKRIPREGEDDENEMKRDSQGGDEYGKNATERGSLTKQYQSQGERRRRLSASMKQGQSGQDQELREEEDINLYQNCVAHIVPRHETSLTAQLLADPSSARPADTSLGMPEAPLRSLSSPEQHNRTITAQHTDTNPLPAMELQTNLKPQPLNTSTMSTNMKRLSSDSSPSGYGSGSGSGNPSNASTPNRDRDKGYKPRLSIDTNLKQNTHRYQYHSKPTSTQIHTHPSATNNPASDEQETSHPQSHGSVPVHVPVNAHAHVPVSIPSPNHLQSIGIHKFGSSAAVKVKDGNNICNGADKILSTIQQQPSSSSSARSIPARASYDSAVSNLGKHNQNKQDKPLHPLPRSHSRNNSINKDATGTVSNADLLAPRAISQPSRPSTAQPFMPPIHNSIRQSSAGGSGSGSIDGGFYNCRRFPTHHRPIVPLSATPNVTAPSQGIARSNSEALPHTSFHPTATSTMTSSPSRPVPMHPTSNTLLQSAAPVNLHNTGYSIRNTAYSIASDASAYSVSEVVFHDGINNTMNNRNAEGMGRDGDMDMDTEGGDGEMDHFNYHNTGHSNMISMSSIGAFALPQYADHTSRAVSLAATTDVSDSNGMEHDRDRERDANGDTDGYKTRDGRSMTTASLSSQSNQPVQYQHRDEDANSIRRSSSSEIPPAIHIRSESASDSYSHHPQTSSSASAARVPPPLPLTPRSLSMSTLEESSSMDTNGPSKNCATSTAPAAVTSTSHTGSMKSSASELSAQLNKESSSSRSSNGKILFIDDNITVRKTVSRQLESLHWKCDLAEDGQVGYNLWLQHRNIYTLVLTDCEMPVVDGYELARMIRRQEKSEKVDPSSVMPILALTANAMSENVDTCVEAGMDKVLTKPLKLVTLRQTLEEYKKRNNNLIKKSTTSPPASASTSTSTATHSPIQRSSIQISSPPSTIISYSQSRSTNNQNHSHAHSPITNPLSSAALPELIG